MLFDPASLSPSRTLGPRKGELVERARRNPFRELARCEPFDFTLSLLVHDASAVGRSLHGRGPPNDAEVRPRGTSELSWRWIGVKIERLPPTMRPRHQTIEQRSAAQYERDSEVSPGRKGAPKRRMEGGLRGQLVARQRVGWLQNEHALVVCRCACNDVPSVESRSFDRDPGARHGCALVGVDHMTRPPSRRRLAHHLENRASR